MIRKGARAAEAPPAVDSRRSKAKVVVVGAGHNGLVCAWYLARAGLEVQVLEARDQVGGACVTEELIPGFRFSTGANVTCWLRPEVVRDMRLLERGLQFSVEGQAVYDCFQIYSWVRPEGAPFLFLQDAERMAAQIASFSRADVRGWEQWTRFWQIAGSIIGPFVMREPPTLAELMARAGAIGAGEVLETVLTTPVGHLADRFFESEVLRNHVNAPHDLGSVLDVGTGLAAALAQAVAGWNEEGLPCPRGYVRGGMGAITQAMAAACREMGVTIRTGAPVERILTGDGTVQGVRLRGGQTLEAALVVSNADPRRTFLRLFAAEDLSRGFLRRVRALRTDVAPLKLHCVLSELPEFPAFRQAGLDPATPYQGALRMCAGRDAYEAAWEDALHGRLPQAPYMDMMVPSVWDPTLAPAERHTASFWILFAPVRLREGQWPERREEMADRLIDQVDSYAPGFRRAVTDRVLLTPHDLEERLLLTDANIHHVDVHPSQMLWQRPLPELARYRGPLHGLYLCGAGMHPYGEVSAAPGHNAAARILRDLGA